VRLERSRRADIPLQSQHVVDVVARVEPHKIAQADGSTLCRCRGSRAGGRVAMVEDALRRVAMVGRAVEVAEDKGAAHDAVTHHCGRKRWWRIRESARDEDGDVSRQS